MLLIFPFLAFLAAAVAAVMLAVRWSIGDAQPLTLWMLLASFLVGAYWQFFAVSAALNAAGLALLTALAVYLLVWWRLNDGGAP